MHSLEDVAATLNDHRIMDTTVDQADWPAEDVLQRRFTQIPGLPMRVTEFEAADGGDTIRMIYVFAYSERAKKRGWWRDRNNQLRPREERISTSKANLLFFEREGQVFCAIQTQQRETVQHLFQELLIPDYWGGIEDAVEYTVDGDFFYWIFERTKRHNGQVATDLEVLNLNRFHGQSLRETHTMRGEGERVIDLLGTLAFVFGNDPFWSMRFEVRLGQDSVSFSYDRHGAANIEEGSYQGTFAEVAAEDARKGVIAYFVYTRVVPTLIREYRQFDRTQWSPQVREDFVRDVGLELLRTVARELALDPDRPLGHYL